MLQIYEIIRCWARTNPIQAHAQNEISSGISSSSVTLSCSKWKKRLLCVLWLFACCHSEDHKIKICLCCSFRLVVLCSSTEPYICCVLFAQRRKRTEKSIITVSLHYCSCFVRLLILLCSFCFQLNRIENRTALLHEENTSLTKSYQLDTQISNQALKFRCEREWFRKLISCLTKTNSARDQPTQPTNHMSVCIFAILYSNVPHFLLYLHRSLWLTHDDGECVHGKRERQRCEKTIFKVMATECIPISNTRLFHPFRLLTIAKSVSLWKLSIQLCQAAFVCVRVCLRGRVSDWLSVFASADFVVFANTVVLSLPRLPYFPPLPPLLPPSLSLSSSNILHSPHCIEWIYEWVYADVCIDKSACRSHTSMRTVCQTSHLHKN